MPDSDLDAEHLPEPMPRTPFPLALCEWSQTTQDVTIFFSLPSNTRAKQLLCELHPNRIRIHTPNHRIHGKLGGDCNVDESTWYIHNDELVVRLDKAKLREWVRPLIPEAAKLDNFAPTVSLDDDTARTLDALQSRPNVPMTDTKFDLAPTVSSEIDRTKVGSPFKMGAPVAVNDQMRATSTLASSYASWDRFDDIEALLSVENEGIGEEPSGLEMRKGPVCSSISVTGYRKDAEELKLDEDLSQRRDELQMSLNHKFSLAAGMKDAANELLHQGRFREALQGYENALGLLNGVEAARVLMAPTLDAAITKLTLDLRNNSAMAALRIGNAPLAEEFARAVLAMDPGNSKAAWRLRRAQEVKVDGNLDY